MATETLNQTAAHDNLTAKLAQLKALLSMTFGGAMGAFNGLTDAIRVTIYQRALTSLTTV